MPFCFHSLSRFLVLSLFFLFPYYVSPVNITSILSQYPSFSSFNNALTQSGVAGEINSRRTITVLAVDNSEMPEVSGQSADMVKKVLSLHVILDYYDVQKLQQLPNKTAILTTLFQASGQANGQLGFLNVSRVGNGQVAFGSAVPGSSLSSELVKPIASQPFNLSVLQISKPILPPGLGGSSNSSTSPPAATPVATPPTHAATPPPKKSPAPVPSPKSSPTAPVSSPKKSPSSPPPATSNAPSPSEAMTPPAMGADTPAMTPSNAASPAADATPAGSPPMPAGANGPAADGPAADAPAKPKSGADARYRMSSNGALILCFSVFWSLALSLW